MKTIRVMLISTRRHVLEATLREQGHDPDLSEDEKHSVLINNLPQHFARVRVCGKH